MALLLLGILLWVGAHVFGRIAPGLRGAMGLAGKALISVLIFAALALMIIGYRQADFVSVWSPPAVFTHLNNLLMIVAVYVYMGTAASPDHVWIARKIRHPQLAGVKIWAIAHLLVNGDLASIVLFGSMLGWAVWNMILINRGVDHFDRSRAPIKSEWVFAISALVVFGLIAVVHAWLGPSPFGG